MFRTLRSSSLSFDQRLSSVLNNCIIPYCIDKVNYACQTESSPSSMLMKSVCISSIGVPNSQIVFSNLSGAS